MSKISFSWNDKKAQINIAKHGVSFEEAATVFADEEAIVFDDPDHSVDENRFLIIGMSNVARILIVCHCYRDNDNEIRIISARKATRKETGIYADFGRNLNNER